MKPAPFEYVRAATVQEALAALAEHGDEARPLAGGQSLVPMMNLRLARPSVLVDINGLDANGLDANGLGGIRMEGRRISLGALVRHAGVLRHGPIIGRAAVVEEVVRCIAHPTIRERGTVGGSLAHADPTAELPVLAMLLEGEIEVRSLTDTRQVPAVDFFRGAFATGLEAGELIVALHLQLPARPWGACFLEAAEREGDFALAAAGVRIELSGDSIAAAAVVLSGARSAPVRAFAAEALLAGERPGAELGRAAARAALEGVESYGDIRGSAGYRRHLLSVLVEEAVGTACERAGAMA